MLSSVTRKKRSSKGFTLIEILVVIAIIGLIITLGFGSYMSTIKKGRDAKRKGDLSSITKALEFYHNDHGHYPPFAAGKMTGCDDPLGGPAIDCEWGSELKVNGVLYMAQLPKDPGSGQSYYYYSDNGAATPNMYYKVYTRLENSEDLQIITPNIGTQCHPTDSSIECNYGVSSSNTLPYDP